MQPIAAWLQVGELGHTVLRASAFAAGCFVVIAVFERRAGVSMSRYTSRHFAIDLLYRLVFILYMAALWNPLVEVVRTAFPGLNLAVLNHAPLWVALPAYWLIFDFLSYWVHRIQHSRYWWRFHRVHHSQEQMTFASAYRNHPIDQLFALSISMVPGLLLGAPAVTWAPYSFLLSFIDATHHANLSWRFGWLRKIFVSPVFHMAHHSTDPAIHNRNFGGLLSMWDFLFGTAYDAERLPERTGVEGWRVPESFWAHLLSPFRRESVVNDPSALPPGA
jgi:sterol desaturase/sphingolipid hydroxylase (fatty acid hydroxylase superfamily)